MQKKTDKAQASESSFWVSLMGWQYDREVRIEDGYAYFQVAGESHCSACQRRIDAIKSLRSSEIRYAYLDDGPQVEHFRGVKMLWAGIPVSQSATKADVIVALRDKLELSIL